MDDYPLDQFLISFGTYGIDMNMGQLLIEGVDPLERSSFEGMVYNKLNKECSLRLCGENKNESISLIEFDFDENAYVQKLQSAISNGDYEAAAMYGHLRYLVYFGHYWNLQWMKNRLMCLLGMSWTGIGMR
jgi:hypothetical protein